MPVYLSLASLIIDKSAVEKKYSGGVEKFRSDYFNLQGNASQEDDQLFLIARMDYEEFDLDKLISFGFEYDAENEYSNDFVIHQRYYDFLWKVDWLEDNSIYAWHINDLDELKIKAKKFEDVTMEVVGNISDAGLIPFLPLTKKNRNTHPIVVALNLSNDLNED
jgi:hypothetical protein